MVLFHRNGKSDTTDINEIFRNLVLLSQLGLSLITPLLFCLGICWWLTVRSGIGGWVFIPGFILGLGGSAMTGYKVYLAHCGDSKKDDKGDKVFFNRHD